MKYTYKNLDNATYTYSTAGENKNIYISNTLSSLCVVGNRYTADNNSLVDNLYSIDAVGSSLNVLSDYCFYNCKNLSSAHISGIEYIGNSCFRADVNLKNIDVFDHGDVVYLVDDYSFANTGLSSIKLNLQACLSDYEYEGCVPADRSIGPYVGKHAFASCYNLKDVEFCKSTELGDNMFDGCSALTSVIFSSNHGSCVGTQAFANCSSLQKIDFPSHFETFGMKMFQNCVNLSSVSISDDEDSKFTSIYERAFDNCQKLSTIILPRSISSIYDIGNNSFKGSSLLSVTFVNANISVEIEQLIKNANDTGQYKYSVDRTTTSDFKYGKWYGNCAAVISYAMQRSIPIMLFESKDGCSFCQRFDNTVLKTLTFQNWMKKQKMLFCYGKTASGACDSTVQRVRQDIQGKGYYVYELKKGQYTMVGYDPSKSGFTYYKTNSVKLPQIEFIQWKEGATAYTQTKVAVSSEKNLLIYDIPSLYFSDYVPDQTMVDESSESSSERELFDFGGIEHSCKVIISNGSSSKKYNWDYSKQKFTN